MSLSLAKKLIFISFHWDWKSFLSFVSLSNFRVLWRTHAAQLRTEKGSCKLCYGTLFSLIDVCHHSCCLVSKWDWLGFRSVNDQSSCCWQTKLSWELRKTATKSKASFDTLLERTVECQLFVYKVPDMFWLVLFALVFLHSQQRIRPKAE